MLLERNKVWHGWRKCVELSGKAYVCEENGGDSY